MQTGQWDSFELPQTHGFPMFGLSNPDSSGESFWWHWVLFGLLQFFFLPCGQKHTIIYENWSHPANILIYIYINMKHPLNSPNYAEITDRSIVSGECLRGKGWIASPPKRFRDPPWIFPLQISLKDVLRVAVSEDVLDWYPSRKHAKGQQSGFAEDIVENFCLFEKSRIQWIQIQVQSHRGNHL